MKWMVEYTQGSDLKQIDCSCTGTAVMVRNHERANGHPDAEMVPDPRVIAGRNRILRMNRDELRKEAANFNIAGRGAMNKEELQQAVLQAAKLL